MKMSGEQITGGVIWNGKRILKLSGVEGSSG
jgi:hypothetical protein